MFSGPPSLAVISLDDFFSCFTLGFDESLLICRSFPQSHRDQSARVLIQLTYDNFFLTFFQPLARLGSKERRLSLTLFFFFKIRYEDCTFRPLKDSEVLVFFYGLFCFHCFFQLRIHVLFQVPFPPFAC